LTRTVADTALMYDAILGTDRYTAAAKRTPSQLRIAWSVKPTTPAPLADEVRRGVDTTMQLLRDFGHSVVERDPPYGIVQTSFVPRYFRGVHKDLHELRDPRKTESRTRAIARLGSLWPMRTVRKARDRGDRLRERMERFFDDVDVLVTPGLSRLPLRAGRYFGKGWFSTFNGIARYTPYTPPWNVTGQPAMVIPAGQSADGFPVAVQLVTRSDGEETLLALGAQLEAARNWAALRPPID
jgi:amidase